MSILINQKFGKKSSFSILLLSEGLSGSSTNKKSEVILPLQTQINQPFSGSNANFVDLGSAKKAPELAQNSEASVIFNPNNATANQLFDANKSSQFLTSPENNLNRIQTTPHVEQNKTSEQIEELLQQTQKEIADLKSQIPQLTLPPEITQNVSPEQLEEITAQAKQETQKQGIEGLKNLAKSAKGMFSKIASIINSPKTRKTLETTVKITAGVAGLTVFVAGFPLAIPFTSITAAAILPGGISAVFPGIPLALALGIKSAVGIAGATLISREVFKMAKSVTPQEKTQSPSAIDLSNDPNVTTIPVNATSASNERVIITPPPSNETAPNIENNDLAVKQVDKIVKSLESGKSIQFELQGNKATLSFNKGADNFNLKVGEKGMKPVTREEVMAFLNSSNKTRGGEFISFLNQINTFTFESITGLKNQSIIVEMKDGESVSGKLLEVTSAGENEVGTIKIEMNNPEDKDIKILKIIDAEDIREIQGTSNPDETAKVKESKKSEEKMEEPVAVEVVNAEIVEEAATKVEPTPYVVTPAKPISLGIGEIKQEAQVASGGAVNINQTGLSGVNVDGSININSIEQTAQVASASNSELNVNQIAIEEGNLRAVEQEGSEESKSAEEVKENMDINSLIDVLGEQAAELLGKAEENEGRPYSKLDALLEIKKAKGISDNNFNKFFGLINKTYKGKDENANLDLENINLESSNSNLPDIEKAIEQTLTTIKIAEMANGMLSNVDKIRNGEIGIIDDKKSLFEKNNANIIAEMLRNGEIWGPNQQIINEEALKIYGILQKNIQDVAVDKNLTKEKTDKLINLKDDLNLNSRNMTPLEQDVLEEASKRALEKCRDAVNV